MKQTFLKVVLALFASILLLGAAQSHSSMAQNPNTSNQQPAAPAPSPQWLSITQLIVKPEMMVEFQNFTKNQTNPALRKGGLKWREVWQNTGVAGNAFEFILVTPIEKLAEFDGPSIIEKGLGKEGYAAWTAKAGTLISSVHRYVIRTRPDLSVQGTRTGPPKLAVVASIHVAPGRNDDFENYTKSEFLPVMRQAQATYLIAQTIFGGDANEYVSLTLRDSFAEIGKGPILVQVLGEEGAQKVIQKLPAGTVVHLERSFVRYVPELSLRPAEPTKQ